MPRMFLVLAVAALAAGCGRGRDVPQVERRPGEKLVGVALRSRSDEFAREFETALRSAAEKGSVQLAVDCADGDAAVQAEQVAAFAAQGVAAIVVVACDARTAARALRAAEAAKI